MDKTALEQTIQGTADEIVQMVEHGFTGSLLRSAVIGALRGIAAIHE